MRQHISIPHDRLLYADCYVKMHTGFYQIVLNANYEEFI